VNQCLYQIKEAGKYSWWHCQLEAGHVGDHKPPRSATGPHLVFEGIWHLPEKKSTADPQTIIPFFGHNSAAGEKQ
jgi:hypothetical protein